jgi:hypothetical protein
MPAACAHGPSAPRLLECVSQALSDPSHEDHRYWSEWIGGSFDPGAFDVTDAEVTLKHFARSYAR